MSLLRALEVVLAMLLACASLPACAHSSAGTRADGSTARARARGTRPLGALELRARGIAALRAGDDVRAEQYLTLAMRAGAPESSVIAPLVQACAGGSRLQSALAHALPYLGRHPDAWRLRQLVAAIELALGRTQRAREELARVTRDHPHVAAAHYLLAVIARDQLGDAPAASAAFAAYLRDHPDGEHAAEARSWLRDQAGASPAAEPATSGAGP